MSYTFKFTDWLFQQLPEYFVVNDSYKNAQGKGLLERYLEAFAIELDDEIVKYIHDFPDVTNIDLSDVKFLPHFGYQLGSPPNITFNPTDYRKFIKHVVSIYKIKGTVCSYQLLFNLLGLNVSVVEHPDEKQTIYDGGFNYDEDNLMDLSCSPCHTYSLFYNSVDDDCTIPTINSVPQALLDKILDIICFLQPIDCKLIDLSHNIKLCEQYTPVYANTVTIQKQISLNYDNSELLDDSNDYDSFITTATTVYNF